MNKAWNGIIDIPLSGRTEKPRKNGITMVIDKGMGLNRMNDLIQTAGEYIDIIKLTFGTSAFYESGFLRRKNDLIVSSGIDVMPGGTFLEVGVWQKAFDRYLGRAADLGFSMIEVSDGTIEMDDKTRKESIQKSLASGFKVVTEVGKKDPEEAIDISVMHDLIKKDLDNGAFKVIIEAREAGKGVGIFDKTGQIKQDELDEIVAGVDDLETLIWEAPIKNQQQTLIMRWGPNVNLGNIPADDILALEALRQGLRGDTLKKAYLDNKDWNR